MARLDDIIQEFQQDRDAIKATFAGFQTQLDANAKAIADLKAQIGTAPTDAQLDALQAVADDFKGLVPPADSVPPTDPGTTPPVTPPAA